MSGGALTKPGKVRVEEEWQPTFLRRIELYAMFGHTAEEISLLLGVRKKVFEVWVRQRGDVQMALARGIPKAEHELEQAAFMRACGYSHPETKVFYDRESGIVEHEITKHYPPDGDLALKLLAKLNPAKWKETVNGVTVNIDNRQVNITSVTADEAAKEYTQLIDG